jgi:hypothetical protein
MLLKSLAVATSLAITAVNAFIVVPKVSEADEGIFKALPFEAPQSSQLRSIKLDCPGCPLPIRKHHKQSAVLTTDIPNHLELIFGIDSESSDTDRLLLNGFELYPNTDPFHGRLRAPQVPDFVEFARKHPRPSRHNNPTLGYSLSIAPLAKDEEQQMDLIGLDLEIIEVGDVFVNTIPAINLKLVKTPQGKLMIADIQTAEPAPASSEECKSLACKWRAIVMQKLEQFKSLKGCGHMRQGNAAASASQRVQYQRYHSWRQLFRNITSHILLPILIGIVAGVSVSM